MSNHETAKPEAAHNANESQSTQGPMSKLFGWIAFGIGMVLAIVFIPASDNMVINFIIGGAVGFVSGGIGSLVGGLLDNK